MESIYESYLESVECGQHFRVDFVRGNLRIGNKQIVKDRRNLTEQPIFFDPELTESDLSIEDRLNYYYQLYKSSNYSKTGNKTWFVTVDEEDLTEEDLRFGDSRNEALFRLALCLMDAIVDGKMQWCVDEMEADNHFFWRSKQDGDFIIFKHWIINTNK